MTRREFTLHSAAALAPSMAVDAASAKPAGPRLVKSICNGMIPGKDPLAKRFRIAKDHGFDAIEIRLEPEGGQLTVNSSLDQVRRLADAARGAGIAIASLWTTPVRRHPLFSPDAAVRAQGSQVIRKALEFAPILGAGALLIVPGSIGRGSNMLFRYEEAWQRSHDELRKLIPFAEKAGVLLTPENVWNRFLLSPLEMRRFVDQFESPWVQVHFDTGNVMPWGYPQDWILTLGSRIKRLHLKDFKLGRRTNEGRFVPLLEGDVDWKAVMGALVKVGYQGYLSPEGRADDSDPQFLTKVSRSVDKIIALA